MRKTVPQGTLTVGTPTEFMANRAENMSIKRPLYDNKSEEKER